MSQMDKMFIAANRLATFTGWSNSVVTPEQLSDAGFYYTGRHDIVCCPYCFMELARWVPGDVPMEEHSRWSPRCIFVKLKKLKFYAVVFMSYSQDESKKHWELTRVGEDNTVHRLFSTTRDTETSTLEELLKSLKLESYNHVFVYGEDTLRLVNEMCSLKAIDIASLPPAKQPVVNLKEILFGDDCCSAHAHVINRDVCTMFVAKFLAKWLIEGGVFIVLDRGTVLCSCAMERYHQHHHHHHVFTLPTRRICDWI